MKTPFRRDRRASDGRRTTIVEELERIIRRVIFIPLAAPILLLGGSSLGKVTARSLDMPEGVPATITAAQATPRIQLELLSRIMTGLRADGVQTEDYVRLYQDHVSPVEHSLTRRGVPTRVARQTAWPLVELAYRNGLDPATVVSVMLIESRGDPRATSFVGARGLMQIMPVHIGSWRDCGDDLYDIQDNLCIGTTFLASLLRRFDGDERRSLLAYNGCVRGTNTPNCHRYPDKVRTLRSQIRAEWDHWSRTTPTAAAAP